MIEIQQKSMAEGSENWIRNWIEVWGLHETFKQVTSKLGCDVMTSLGDVTTIVVPDETDVGPRDEAASNSAYAEAQHSYWQSPSSWWWYDGIDRQPDLASDSGILTTWSDYCGA